MRFSFLVLVTAISICFGSTAMAQYSGEYDVGGGDYDFNSPLHAATSISINGVTGPVICNIYSGTMWTGTLNFPYNIPGVSPVNTITFRNAPGESPVLTQPYYNQHIVNMISADYITIEGLEFDGCEDDAIYFEGSETDSCKGIRIIGNYVHNFGTWTGWGSSGILAGYSADCVIIGNEVDGDEGGIEIYDCDRILIANNMVYDCESTTSPSQNRCIQVLYSGNISIYHNSAHSVRAHILYSHQSGLSIYNNVFYQDYPNMPTNYCALYLFGSSFVSDYNNLYAPDSYVGFYLNQIQTFEGWQDTVGVDSNSISADPNFVSSTNLHVNDPSPLGYAGIAIPEVTEDFDGDPRKTPHPDIGVDEFVYPLAGSYDINGGNHDFATIDEAIDRAVYAGLSDHVTFYVYSGTYNGQINIPDIPTTSDATTLSIQVAYGETAIITNTTGTTQTDGNGFYLDGADYVTIQGFEITNTAANGIVNTYAGSDSSSHNSFLRNYIHDVGVLGDYAGIYLLNSPDCEVIGNEIDGDYYGIQLSTSERCLIANNMVYFASLSGIYDNEGVDNHCYFNSVYQGMSSTTTYNLYLYNNTNSDVKNNILYQNGTGIDYAIYIAGDLSAYPVTSDYNDLYAPNAHVGYYSGDLTTVTNWQTATGLDSNSISADPSFVSTVTPNLHINPPSPVEMAAIFIPEVTYDFDLDSRFIGQPDIGADEFVSAMAGTYDIGGGAMDYESIREAVQELNEGGMAGPVTFNVFTGLYHNQVDITCSISGLGVANPLVIQNAPGESPQMISTAGKGFQITNADYVTIQGMEIYSCAFEGISITGSYSDSSSHIRIINNYIHDVGTYYTGNYHGILLNYCVDCEIIGNEIEGDDYGLTSHNSSGNLFANNMIYSCLSTGLRSFMCNDDQYYYNSIYVDQGNGFEISGSSGLTIKNNSIFNDGSSFLFNYACYSLQNVSLPSITSNYNNLYAPDPLCYVGYNVSTSTSYLTLPQWQTATGWDVNSISADPGYLSITMNIDLHITESSPLDSAATPITGILVDFDGESRHTVYPDIGADEVGIVEPLEPVEDLVITLSNGTDITLTWSPISGAQQYHIYKSTTDPGSGYILLDSSTDTTYTDTNVLINELKSFFYVTADNEPLDTGLDKPPSGN